MADEAQDHTSAVEEETEETTYGAEAVVEEPKKSVKFEANELTFDEAQAEIDAIKARAGQARESLKSVPAANYSTTSSYSHYTSSSMPAEDEVPKSKNMLSHLNSNSAMINYKVTTARNLVQKQEALLRNLKMMRENMERSSVEISRASDYFSPVRVPARGYFEKRAESAPLISRRQVRDVSPVVSSSCKLETSERISERAYSPKPAISSHISTLPHTLSSADYQPDEDFEKEMAALRKRVADLSKQANEVPTPRYSSYDYESPLLDTYQGGQTDPCVLPETKIEVKSPRTHKFASPKTLHTKTTSRDVYTRKHASDDNGMSYPRNSYTDYLMEVVNDLDSHSTGNHLDMNTLYSDPLQTSVADYPAAY